MDITKQFSILEDIYRLLYYLDWLADNDRVHFQHAGYSARFERDTALWELKHKIKFLIPHIYDTYLLSFDDITEVEKRNLYDWVNEGNSVFENPYLISDDSGRPMDFINAFRFNDEMYKDFMKSAESESGISPVDDWDCDDELPF